jgi:undecaprenyl-diphosphatase
MLGSFFIVGLIFFVIEFLIKKDKMTLNKSTTDMTWTQAILIGVFQAFAVVPGVSRAGAVIVGMMVFGFKRDEAAKYSFTLAVPTILAAAALDLIKSRSALTGVAMSQNMMLLGVGSVAAFVSSLLIVAWFIKYLKTHSLNVFGGYRMIVTALLLLLGFTK